MLFFSPGVPLGMLLCKIFSGTDALQIEEAVNIFLQKTPELAIDSLCQSNDSNVFYLSVFFRVRVQTNIEYKISLDEIKAYSGKNAKDTKWREER